MATTGVLRAGGHERPADGPRGRDRRPERRLRVRRARLPDADLQRRPTTGWTSCSARTRRARTRRRPPWWPRPRRTAPRASSSAPTSTATFSEPLAPATVDGTHRPAPRRRRPARPGHRHLGRGDAAPRSSTRPLAPSPTRPTYTATVKGGAGGVTDLAGNPLAADVTWTLHHQAAPPPPPDEGPGRADPRHRLLRRTRSRRYYAEILRAEGLNAFKVIDISAVDATVLAGYDVVILGEMPLTPPQVTMLSDWVNGGGNLIAMRPDAAARGACSASPPPARRSPTATCAVDTAAAPGRGHRRRRRSSSTARPTATRSRRDAAAVAVATLYSNATTATTNPAVTLRTRGRAGGEAAAFTFDLARSIVYTRQGNPAWAGEERDGDAPDALGRPVLRRQGGRPAARLGQPRQGRDPAGRRAAAPARQPDPEDERGPQAAAAVLVLPARREGGRRDGRRQPRRRRTSRPRFDGRRGRQPGRLLGRRLGVHPRDRVPLHRRAARATRPRSSGRTRGSRSRLHVNTELRGLDPDDAWPASTRARWRDFFATFPSLAPLATNRTHCIAWSDWATQPKVELANGIRLDTNYYYWPPAWVSEPPGLLHRLRACRCASPTSTAR